MCVDDTVENKHVLFNNMQFHYLIINKMLSQIHKCKAIEQSLCNDNEHLEKWLVYVSKIIHSVS